MELNEKGWSGEKILIVDDEQEILDSLSRHFEIEGLDVDTCASAGNAFKMMGEHTYNIVLTDISMAGINGVELLNSIKKRNPMCNVIIMTAYSNMAHLMDCFSAGASDYFAKPFQDIGLLVWSVKCSIERVRRWRKGMGFENFHGTP